MKHLCLKPKDTPKKYFSSYLAVSHLVKTKDALKCINSLDHFLCSRWTVSRLKIWQELRHNQKCVGSVIYKFAQNILSNHTKIGMGWEIIRIRLHKFCIHSAHTIPKLYSAFPWSKKPLVIQHLTFISTVLWFPLPPPSTTMLSITKSVARLYSPSLPTNKEGDIA